LEPPVFARLVISKGLAICSAVAVLSRACSSAELNSIFNPAIANDGRLLSVK